MSNGSTNKEFSTDESSQPPKHQRIRRLLLVVLPLIALLFAGVAYLKGGRYVETDNAYIKNKKIPISAEVSGKIKEVLIIENQPVDVGQILFRIDPAPFQMAATKAEAKLAEVKINLAALKAGYHTKQAEIISARTEYHFAQNNQRRQAELLSQHLISASSFDDVKQAADLALRHIDTLELDLKRIAETLGGSINQPLEQHPSYRIALVELEQARLDLTRCEVRAPQPGFVSKLPNPGQYLGAGDLATILLVSDDPWVEANFTETDLTHVQPGQSVSIHIDTYPDLEWQGVVESLSPATGAEFSVIPAQNVTGNWVKIAQRLPVRIKIVANPSLPPLRAGLSTIVKIDADQHRLLLGFSL